MKKLITLTFFAFAMLLSTANGFAQDKKEIHKVAFEKTETLRKNIKFNTLVQDEVYEVFKQYETNMAVAKKNLSEGKTVTSADFEKIKSTLNSKIKALLTEEQFDVYKTLQVE